MASVRSPLRVMKHEQILKMTAHFASENYDQLLKEAVVKQITSSGLKSSSQSDHDHLDVVNAKDYLHFQNDKSQ